MADEATERITILLQAKDADFQRQLDRNNKALAKFEREATRNVSGAAKKIDANLQSMAASVGNFAKGFAGGLIGAGIGIAVSATLGQIESLINGLGELQDQADILDLGVEELQGLRYGFQLAGVDADKLNGGLQRFTSLVGDAAEGQGALAKVFSAAGVPLTDMNGELRSTSDLLREFADIMAATPEGAERLALATEVFGKAGRNLVLGLEGGSSGLDAMVEEARKAGAVLDEELVRRAEEIGDKWDALKMRITVALQEIAVGIADVGDKMATAVGENLSQFDPRPMTEAEQELLDVTRQLADEVRLAGAYLATLGRDADAANMEDLAAAIDDLARRFEAGSISADVLSASLTKIAPLAQGALSALDSIDGIDLSNAAARIGDLIGWLGDLRRNALLAANAVAAAVLSPTPSATGTTGPAGGPAPLASPLAPQSSVRPPSAPALLGEPDLGGGGGRRGGGGGISDDAKEAQRIFEATRTEAERYAAALAHLDELQAMGLLTSETYARALSDLKDKYLDAGDAAKFWDDTEADLKDGILDAIVAGDDLSETMENLARSIAKAALQAALFGEGPMAMGGSGLLGGVFDSIFGGARATGGPVSAGKAYLVGERGPEYFVPPHAGKIIPNGANVSSRGISVAIGFDESVGGLTAMVRDEAGRVVAQAAPQIVGRSVQAVRQQSAKTKAFLGR